MARSGSRSGKVGTAGHKENVKTALAARRPCGAHAAERSMRTAMNIAFFLTPKADVAWVRTTSTVRQAIERMEHYRYTAVPLLTPEGCYAGTLTEGDLLWFFKQSPSLRFQDTEHVPLEAVTRRVNLRPIHINAYI